MEGVLQAEGLHHAIQELPEVDEETPAQAAQAIRARGLLVVSIDDTYLSYVRECTTAREVWLRLKSVFQPRSQAQQLQLRQDLGNLRMEGNENVTSYYARAQALWSKLSSSGYLIDEAEVVWSFLSGLSIEFATVSLVLRSGERATSFASVFSELLDFERTVKREQPEGHVSAYKARVKHDSKKIVCFFCKEKGHMKRDCKEWKEWMDGQGFSTGRRKELTL